MISTETKAGITWQRRGLSPLPLQMGLIQAEYMRMQQMGLADERDLRRMIAGIKSYQEHPFVRRGMSADIVWQQGEVRLLYKKAVVKPENAMPLLLIPSLINKADILNITEEKSFQNWLSANGVDCYLLDWGQPATDDYMRDMNSLFSERLLPAIDHIAKIHDNRIAALGYCMGGTLLAAAAQLAENKIGKCVFLASPWDFEAGDQRLRKEVRAGMAPALQRIAADKKLPKDWIQSVFAAVNAQRAIEKFGKFADMDQDSVDAALFVAVEDWLNDGVDLPSALAETCIRDWYDQNLTGKLLWTVSGEVINPQQLSMPCFVVASETDVIVPFESSVSMAREIKNAQLFKTGKGHIGMITGKNAENEVWKHVLNWLHSSA